MRESVAQAHPSAPSPVYPPVSVTPAKVRIAASKPQEPPRTTYAEKLRDPRWQKKRLEVMEFDGFTCRRCGAKDKTLNVHHMFYEKGKAPWEYDFQTLITLCEGCHASVEDFELKVSLAYVAVAPINLEVASHLLAKILRSIGLQCDEVNKNPECDLERSVRVRNVLVSALAAAQREIDE